MKVTKLILLTVFLILMDNLAFAQQPKHELLIGLRGMSIHSERFDPGKNIGFGVFTEYGRSIFPELKITWRTQLGVDYIPSCRDFLSCDSWWYYQPVRLNTYLNMSVYENEKHDISLGLGGGVFYGSKYFRTLVYNQPEVVVIWTYDTAPTAEYCMSAMVSYHNKDLSERLRFRYGMDVFWKTQLHSFSVVYKLL